MDLKLYSNNASAGYEPTPQGTWTDATPRVIKKCSTTKDASGTPTSTGSQVGDGTSGHTYHELMLVSDALAAAINFVTGTAITAVTDCYESSGSCNAYLRAHVWVTQGDSSSVRGVILNNFEDAEEASSTTAAAGEDWDSPNGTPPTVANTFTAQAGDRIVVELGAKHNTTSTTYYTNMRYGGSAADLTDGGDRNTYPGWMIFTYSAATTPGALAVAAVSAVASAGAVVHATLSGAIAPAATSAVIVAGGVLHAIWSAAIPPAATSAVAAVGTVVHATHQGALSSAATSAVAAQGSVVHATHQGAVDVAATSVVVAAGTNQEAGGTQSGEVAVAATSAPSIRGYRRTDVIDVQGLPDFIHNDVEYPVTVTVNHPEIAAEGNLGFFWWLVEQNDDGTWCDAWPIGGCAVLLNDTDTEYEIPVIARLGATVPPTPDEYSLIVVVMLQSVWVAAGSALESKDSQGFTTWVGIARGAQAVEATSAVAAAGTVAHATLQGAFASAATSGAVAAGTVVHATHQGALASAASSAVAVAGDTATEVMAWDPFSRSESNGWGTADIGGVWSIIAGTTSDFSVSSNMAHIDVSVVNSSRTIALQTVIPESPDLLMRFRYEATPSGASVYAIPLCRYVSSSYYYGVRVGISTSNSGTLIPYRRNNDVNETFGTSYDLGTLSPGSWYWVRVQCEGNYPTNVRGKCWADGSGEPADWQTEASDTTAGLQTTGAIGLRCTLNTGNTNSLPYMFDIDDYECTGIPSGALPAALAPYELPITIGNDTYDLRYDLGEVGSGTKTRAIIVVHGDSRNAPDYCDYITGSSQARGECVVLAPQFLTSADIDAFGAPADTLYWSESGWKSGNTSLTYPYARNYVISSFTALDELIDYIVATYTSVTDIVVTGYSAGGQFVQRYAMATAAPSTYSGITFSFAPGASGSYAYVTPHRWNDPNESSFDALTSGEQTACPNWDTYKYGLQGLNEYMGAVGITTLRSNFAARTVTYFVGTLDNDDAADGLDTSAAAEWQGTDRLQRCRVFYNSLAYYYGSTPTGHTKIEVSGIAHNASGSYDDVALGTTLFGLTTKQGAVAAAASSALAVAGSVVHLTQQGNLSAAVASAVVAAGSVAHATPQGALAVAAASAVASSGTVVHATHQAALAVAATSAVASAGSVAHATLAGALAVAATSSVAVAGSVVHATHQAALSSAATSAVATQGGVSCSGAVAVAGTSAVVADAQVVHQTQQGALSPVAASTVAVVGAVQHVLAQGQLSLPATSAVAATGFVSHAAPQGSLTVSAESIVATVGSVVHVTLQGAVAPAATSAVAVAGTRTPAGDYGAIDVPSSSSVAAAGSAVFRGALSPAAASAVAAAGTVAHATLAGALAVAAQSAVGAAGSVAHVTHQGALSSVATSAVVVAGAVSHAYLAGGLTPAATSAVAVAGTVLGEGLDGALAVTATSAVAAAGTVAHATLQATLAVGAVSTVAVAGTSGHPTHQGTLAVAASSGVVAAGQVAHATVAGALAVAATSAVVVAAHAKVAGALAVDGTTALVVEGTRVPNPAHGPAGEGFQTYYVPAEVERERIPWRQVHHERKTWSVPYVVGLDALLLHERRRWEVGYRVFNRVGVTMRLGYQVHDAVLDNDLYLDSLAAIDPDLPIVARSNRAAFWANISHLMADLQNNRSKIERPSTR